MSLLFLWRPHLLMLLRLPRLPGTCGCVCMLLVRAGLMCLLLSMRWVPLLGLLLALRCWRSLLPPAALLVWLLPLLLPPAVLLLRLRLRLPHASLLPVVLMLTSHLMLLLLPLVLLLVISVRLAMLLLLLLHAWLLPVVLSLLPTSG
jgi:hypothetical protein